MKKIDRRAVVLTVAAVLLASALLLLPSAALGQVGRVTLVDPLPRAGVRGCASAEVEDGSTWSAVYRARQTDEERAKTFLAALHDSLALEVEGSPADVGVQYLLAVVIGVRTDLEGGRTGIGLAKQMHRQVRIVLELDPSHPGAHHLLGRLHAAVLRLDGVSRFVATRLLGGSELRGASWDAARQGLEKAVVGAPCVPDHHYELARLYAEQGDRERAIERLRDAVELARPDGPFADVHSKGRLLLARLEGSGSEARAGRHR